MPQYWTPSGLAAIAQTESGGNPTSHDPTSSASGLYGFLNSTWANFAPKAGVDINQYPTAASAPSSVQTAVASITPISNWTCPGCNSAASGIASQLGNVTDSPLVTVGLGDSVDPGYRNFNAPSSAPDFFSVSDTPGSQSNHPITDGVSNTNSNGDSFSFNDPNSLTSNGITTAQNNDNYNYFGTRPLSADLGQFPGLNDTLQSSNYNYFGLSPLSSSLGDATAGTDTGLPSGIIPGLQQAFGGQSAGSGNTFWQTVLNNLTDKITRFGLILLAIALIAVAAWALSKGGLQKQAARLMEA